MLLLLFVFCYEIMQLFFLLDIISQLASIIAKHLTKIIRIMDFCTIIQFQNLRSHVLERVTIRNNCQNRDISLN